MERFEQDFDADLEEFKRQVQLEAEQRMLEQNKSKTQKSQDASSQLKEQGLDVKQIQQLFQDCHQLPKIELHNHISGSLRAETFMELCEKKGVSIEHIDFYNINLQMGFEIFKCVSQVVTSNEIMYRVVREIIQDSMKHNVRYLELRTTPKEFKDSEGNLESAEKYVQNVIQAIKDGEEEFNGDIRVRLLLSLQRIPQYNEERSKGLIDLAIKFKEERNTKIYYYNLNKYVVGIELSGDPRVGSFDDYKIDLERAKEAGLKITLHCGETESQMNENSDMINFKPNRLGHCYHMTNEEYDRIVEQNIPVEFCLTSNACTNTCSVISLMKHLKEFSKRKHNIILCVDDTLLFANNNSHELFEYAKAVGATSKDLQQIQDQQSFVCLNLFKYFSEIAEKQMQLNLPKQLYMPDYEAEKVKCLEFLSAYQEPTLVEDALHGKLKYMIQLQKIANRESNYVNIEIDDLSEYFNNQRDGVFVDRIKMNTMRYVSLFSGVIDQIMPAPSVNFREEDMSTFEIIMNQRKLNLQQYQQNQTTSLGGNANMIDAKMQLPPELERSYQVFIINGQNAKKAVQRMRDIRSNQIGTLVTCRGIVTRVSDVRPCIQVAVYACDVCGYEVYQIVNTREFTPKVECDSKKCRTNQTKGQLMMQVKSSKFVSFQEIKIQEPSEQVPIGHVPRSMKCVAKGINTRRCGPGDIVTITGVYLPAPFQGFAAMRAGLAHDTYLECFNVSKDIIVYRILTFDFNCKQNFKESFLSAENLEKVDNLRASSETDYLVYTRLAESICPEIFGMDEVKRALLLLMVGGVTKEMVDGMKIRGTINVLLMGDPGVAKSQLLKHIATFAPRGIYTTGKGSSGVGLTAAVTRDTITKELVLEGGALVLSDTGICCIDEFDKMDERDRTNIHEVMEQQTVSIAKAGITTSLNARTSILAAANPLYGRYNQKLKPHENINLPAALLSRFDLLFLLLDQINEQNDQALARHVATVHRTLKAPVRENYFQIDAEVMRAFIAKAQQFQPVIPHELHNQI